VYEDYQPPKLGDRLKYGKEEKPNDLLGNEITAFQTKDSLNRVNTVDLAVFMLRTR
jgi:hypothetical protein